MKTEICTVREGDRTAVRRAAQVLRAGGLVAFPTETVYGLGGNGLNPRSARKIYEAKGRPSDNPLILHIAARRELDPLVRAVPPTAERLMEAFWPGPMTLIFQKSERVPAETTGGQDTVAVRLPSHPTARALIEEAGVPVAAPSANLSGRPSPTTARHVEEDLAGRIDLILDGGPVEIGLESTIIDVTGPVPVILRPGAVSREQVAQLAGDCGLDPAARGKPEPTGVPRAPGMKYRHYAPRAQVTIVEGTREKTAAWINRRVQEEAGERRVAILCAEESAGLYPPSLVRVVGSRRREETIAHNLYRCLREFDEEGIQVVFSESFGEGAWGTAIMNRLTRAAGFRVVHAEKLQKN